MKVNKVGASNKHVLIEHKIHLLLLEALCKYSVTGTCVNVVLECSHFNIINFQTIFLHVG